MARILVVDDEPHVSHSIALNLMVAEFQALEAKSGEEAIRLIEKEIYDLVICDLRLEKMSGLEVLRHIKQCSPDTEVLLMTAYAAVDTAVQAMKEGAYDYISKPFQNDELVLTVRKALEHNHLRLRVRQLEQRMRETYGFENLVAASESMQALLRTIAALSGTEATVLITGESGTGKELVVNARVIAATNRDLRQLMQTGAFRDDLFYRLNVIPLHIPPLRERREDILLLAQHFLKKHAPRMDRPRLQLSKEAQSGLLQYHWPGNVRELDHAIEHAATLSNNEMLQPNDLPAPIAQPQTLMNAIKKADREHHKGSLAEVEKAYIFKVLQDTQWNQKQACKILQISKATLYRRLKEYGRHNRLKNAAATPEKNSDK